MVSNKKTYGSYITALTLHDALPISQDPMVDVRPEVQEADGAWAAAHGSASPRTDERQDDLYETLAFVGPRRGAPRSEEHTSELQSHVNLVCRLLLVKKNIKLPHKRY